MLEPVEKSNNTDEDTDFVIASKEDSSEHFNISDQASSSDQQIQDEKHDAEKSELAKKINMKKKIKF